MMLDFEVCKKFFIEWNDEGKLNIDMLIVVVFGELCIIVVDWVLVDWFYFDFGGR